MTDLGIQAWQIPLLVSAAVVLVEIAVNAVLRRRGNLTVDKRVRTAGLVLLLALSVVMFVVVLGPSLAESLSSVAAAVAAVAALWLTYRSVQASRETGRAGTGGPAPRAARPGAAPAPATDGPAAPATDGPAAPATDGPAAPATDGLAVPATDGPAGPAPEVPAARPPAPAVSAATLDSDSAGEGVPEAAAPGVGPTPILRRLRPGGKAHRKG